MLIGIMCHVNRDNVQQVLHKHRIIDTDLMGEELSRIFMHPEYHISETQ